MASTRSSGGSPPRRDALDDTVPAKGEGPPSGAKPPSVEPREEPPIRPTIPIDRYRIGKELGRGGMGRVVEAFDVQLGRTVALKEVLPKTSSGTHRRFAREIHITARLEHPAIVPLYDSGINNDGKPFYVMRRVSGQPLDELIARAKNLDDRLTLLPSLLAAIDAVGHAHDRGVIHRDLKPANILIGEHGETIVIDWGLAKVVGEVDEPADDEPDDADASDSLRTQVGSVFGTPGFMSPEQARGEALDLEGDVYALGAVLYQLLAGAPPVAGISATEVMDKTRTHDIKPLSETAPGAPRELVAIVDKAHAFDPSNRYPDAGALAEDVRRFLAGQLVAAHDYTNWQRLARFARRHRGALSVAALATVAGAVMAWIGVHRIVSERDGATEARAEADAEKRDALDARDRLAERHDQLVISQAKGLLDGNPTEAIAVLKQLPSTSKRLDDARAIGQAAITRGVAWGLQTTTTHTFWATQDFEGKHLALSSRDGTVRVFELERRRLLVAHAFATDSRADWVFGNKLLITHRSEPPMLFDPATDTIEPLALPVLHYAHPSAAGERAVVIHEEPRTASIYDAAKRTLIPLGFPEPVSHVEMSHDAKWTVVQGSKLIVVYDRDGKEALRRDAVNSRVLLSRHEMLAVLTDGRTVVECKLGAKPEWTDVVIPMLAEKHSVYDFKYRGRELMMYLTTGDVVGWNGTATRRHTTVESLTMGLHAAGDETLIVPSTDGKLHWINELGRGSLVLPESVRGLRISAHPGSSRVVSVSDGVVFVYELSQVMPRRYRVGKPDKAVFADDDTVLWQAVREDNGWRWLELSSGKITPIKALSAMPTIWGFDPSNGRVLVRDVGPEMHRYYVLRKGETKADVVADGPKAWAQLVEGDAVIYGLGDNQVFARVGNEAVKPVAKADGPIQHAVALGHLTYAARSNTGEVLRGDLSMGTVERIRVPMGHNGFLVGDHRGRVLIVEDNRLMLWDGQVSEVARFDKPIVLVSKLADGVALFVGNEYEAYALRLDNPPAGPAALPRRLMRAPKGGGVSDDGKLLAAFTTGQDITIVEVPSLARWRLPPLASTRDMLAVAPRSRKLLQITGSTIAVWQLPHVANDFASWLDSQTNATLDRDGVLAWPWQMPKGP